MERFYIRKEDTEAINATYGEKFAGITKEIEALADLVESSPLEKIIASSREIRNTLRRDKGDFDAAYFLVDDVIEKLEAIQGSVRNVKSISRQYKGVLGGNVGVGGIGIRTHEIKYVNIE